MAHQLSDGSVHIPDLGERKPTRSPQGPEFPVAAGNDRVAACERATEITNTETQHRTNDGGNPAPIGCIVRLVLQAQLGCDSAKQCFLSPATGAITNLFDQARTF